MFIHDFYVLLCYFKAILLSSISMLSFDLSEEEFDSLFLWFLPDDYLAFFPQPFLLVFVSAVAGLNNRELRDGPLEK